MSVGKYLDTDTNHKAINFNGDTTDQLGMVAVGTDAMNFGNPATPTLLSAATTAGDETEVDNGGGTNQSAITRRSCAGKAKIILKIETLNDVQCKLRVHFYGHNATPFSYYSEVLTSLATGITRNTKVGSNEHNEVIIVNVNGAAEYGVYLDTLSAGSVNVWGAEI
jgi:hypothetical protein